MKLSTPINSPDEQDPDLPPPGSRWGSGAQSVLPYLTKTLRARPASAAEQGREASPTAESRAGQDERSVRHA